MRKLAVCLFLALTVVVNVSAMEVPTQTVVQNLNGSQQCIKTYTLLPNVDPQELVESPFEQGGFLYTFSDITKEEQRLADSKYQVETVTVDISDNKLSTALSLLDSTLDYNDGEYSGLLVLDHDSISIHPSGHVSKTRTVTETKTIGPLDRNDMSYIPSTTVKDGTTLNLANVEWQVTGTDLVGDVLAPASYQAVATYTGQSKYSVATGYIASAEYMGTVSRDKVSSITYRVTYLGSEVVAERGEETQNTGILSGMVSMLPGIVPYILGAAGLLVIVILSVMLVRSRKELRQLEADDAIIEDGEEDTEHET